MKYVYHVECLNRLPWAFGGWYFVSEVSDLTKAVELAAVMREIKNTPSRVVGPIAVREYRYL